tara:strand:+ start:15046 stop:15486 length:441 start_codon:yes stop_codon:yes gene_type:complete
MAYFYAGLGIAMITGITAMMQVAMNFRYIDKIGRLKEDIFLNDSNSVSNEKDILSITYNINSPFTDVCEYVLSKLEVNTVYLAGGKTSAKHSLIKNSCILETYEKIEGKDYKHRLLINNNSSPQDNNYEVYSCYIPKSIEKCIFEF